MNFGTFGPKRTVRIVEMTMLWGCLYYGCVHIVEMTILWGCLYYGCVHIVEMTILWGCLYYGCVHIMEVSTLWGVDIMKVSVRRGLTPTHSFLILAKGVNV